MEVKYSRREEIIRGKHYPEQQETVVVFVPNVWNSIPEYEKVLIIMFIAN